MILVMVDKEGICELVELMLMLILVLILIEGLFIFNDIFVVLIFLYIVCNEWLDLLLMICIW